MKQPMPEINRSNNAAFLLPFGSRFMLFVFVTALCMIVGGLLVALLAQKGTAFALRVSAILQDLFIFVVPSLATACIITRMPARFLMVDKPLRLLPVLIGLAGLIVSVPAMNAVVAWNESLRFPACLSSLEEAMRHSEQAARTSIDILMGGRRWGADYIMSVLVVGVMAGFSEELFFRGTLQRLLATGPVNIHAAIWITAFVFSAIHMQFYGFVPRLLLGAYFGYIAWITQSVWVPVMVHIFNNTLVVTGEFDGGSFGEVINSVGTGHDDTLLVYLSAFGVAVLMWCLFKVCYKR